MSFHVAKGEFLAVTGHNGSGKSTLAKLANALLLPSGGAVYVDGMDTRDEANLLKIRQKLGVVFQNPDNQIVTTVVEEDVAFGPENLGVPSAEIRERVDAALRSVHMGEYAASAPHMLSGGQKQRVAIAGMLAMRPEALILDEATSMLDPQGREDVLSIIKRLNHEEGMTVVMITQYMEEAVLADRMLVLDRGRLLLEGSPREVFAQPSLLRAHRLDVPETAKLREALLERGWDMPHDALTMEEMTQAICRSL
ncbi:MAG: energy-coupling factor transporter ATPase [Firmicutes bacterium]|nr:energy-coupling factor transporter ATPase [Bacillota bacterium]